MTGYRGIVALVAVLTLTLAGTARAATVTVSGSDLVVDAKSGEVNDLEITLSGDGSSIRLNDAGATFGPSNLCATSGGRAVCPRAGIEGIRADLRDGADRATNRTALSTSLTGGAGADVLTGGPGADRFEEGSGPSGADVLTGGGGHDVVDYSGRSAALAVDSDGVADDGETHPIPLLAERDNVGADVEGVRGGSGDDTLTGGAAANVLSGGLGEDTLTGLAGDDTFDEGSQPAGSGADVLAGGGGTDTADYSRRPETPEENDVGVSLDGEADDGFDCPVGPPGCEGDNVGADVENVAGGEGRDLIVGNAAENRFEGNGSRDEFVGGGGADVMLGGPGGDEVNYEDADAGGRVTFDGVANDGERCTSSSAGPCESDNLASDMEHATGTTGWDEFVGTAANNVFVGDSGNDRFAAGFGSDFLFGGPGDDSFDEGGAPNGGDEIGGGGGTDTVDYSARTGDLAIFMNDQTGDGEGCAIFSPPTGCEGDNVSGDTETVLAGSGDDRIRDGFTHNLLSGGAGDDRLSIAGSATLGSDRAACGEGDDRVVNGTGSDAVDADCELTDLAGAPETTLTSVPPESGASSAVRFEFVGSEPGSTFECRVDPAPGAGWVPCASPHALTDVAPGAHRFEVRARDALTDLDLLVPGDRDPSPAVHNFDVG
jgi:Ca2+-binding RTX toxin-like protein